MDSGENQPPPFWKVNIAFVLNLSEIFTFSTVLVLVIMVYKTMFNNNQNVKP